MPEGTFRRDRILTELSIRRSPGKMVAEVVAPIVGVDDRSGYFPVFGAENLTVRDDRRAPGAEAKPSRWSTTDTHFRIGGHALKHGIPRETQKDAGPNWDLIRSTTGILTDQQYLAREAAFVTLLAAGMTGTSLAAQTTTPWNDDDVDPIALIKAQRLVCILRGYGAPNVFVAAEPVYDAICMNANVRGLVTGAQTASAAVIEPADLARLIGVDQVVVASAVYNSAAEGQTATGAWVWGEYALLAVVAPNPAPEQPTLAVHLAWRNATEVLAGDTGTRTVTGYRLVERYWNQPTKEDIVEVHAFVDPLLICSGAGCLFSDCLA